MDRSEVITLIEITYTEDKINQQIPQETRKDVFCKVTGVSSVEFFEAGKIGLRPSCRAIVFAFDYNGEDVVELQGVRYSVYRTYTAKNETTELYLSEKGGV